MHISYKDILLYNPKPPSESGNQHYYLILRFHSSFSICPIYLAFKKNLFSLLNHGVLSHYFIILMSLTILEIIDQVFYIQYLAVGVCLLFPHNIIAVVPPWQTPQKRCCCHCTLPHCCPTVSDTHCDCLLTWWPLGFSTGKLHCFPEAMQVLYSS